MESDTLWSRFTLTLTFSCTPELRSNSVGLLSLCDTSLNYAVSDAEEAEELKKSYTKLADGYGVLGILRISDGTRQPRSFQSLYEIAL